MQVRSIFYSTLPKSEMEFISYAIALSYTLTNGSFLLIYLIDWTAAFNLLASNCCITHFAAVLIRSFLFVFGMNSITPHPHNIISH